MKNCIKLHKNWVGVRMKNTLSSFLVLSSCFSDFLFSEEFEWLILNEQTIHLIYTDLNFFFKFGLLFLQIKHFWTHLKKNLMQCKKIKVS